MSRVDVYHAFEQKWKRRGFPSITPGGGSGGGGGGSTAADDMGTGTVAYNQLWAYNKTFADYALYVGPRSLIDRAAASTITAGSGQPNALTEYSALNLVGQFNASGKNWTSLVDTDVQIGPSNNSGVMVTAGTPAQGTTNNPFTYSLQSRYVKVSATTLQNRTGIVAQGAFLKNVYINGGITKGVDIGTGGWTAIFDSFILSNDMTDGSLGNAVNITNGPAPNVRIRRTLLQGGLNHVIMFGAGATAVDNPTVQDARIRGQYIDTNHMTSYGIAGNFTQGEFRNIVFEIPWQTGHAFAPLHGNVNLSSIKTWENIYWSDGTPIPLSNAKALRSGNGIAPYVPPGTYASTRGVIFNGTAGTVVENKNIGDYPFAELGGDLTGVEYLTGTAKMVYDDTAAPVGGKSVRVTAGATGGTVFRQWDQSGDDIFWRIYIKLNQYPGATMNPVVSYLGPNAKARFRIKPTGLCAIAITLPDGTSQEIFSLTNQIPLNKWIRFEGRWKFATDNTGFVSLAFFDSQGDVPIDQGQQGQLTFQNGAIDSIRFGSPINAQSIDYITSGWAVSRTSGLGSTVGYEVKPPVPVPTARTIIPCRNQGDLVSALGNAVPGQSIRIYPGIYDGIYKASGNGTEVWPIRVYGPRDAIMNGTPQANGGDLKGYVFHVDNANWWRFEGFQVRNGQKGLVVDESSDNVFDGLDVNTSGQELFHIRNFSYRNTVQNCEIHNSGLASPQFGEGGYIGNAHSNWASTVSSRTKGAVDTSDYNNFINNNIYDVTAECIDIKEGTKGGIIRGNTMNGSKIRGMNSADAWIDCKGDNYLIEGNTGYNTRRGYDPDQDVYPFMQGFEVHNEWANFGGNNTFRNNIAHVNAPGYGFFIEPVAPSKDTTIIEDNNLVYDADSGYTNIAKRVVATTEGGGNVNSIYSILWASSNTRSPGFEKALSTEDLDSSVYVFLGLNGSAVTAATAGQIMSVSWKLNGTALGVTSTTVPFDLMGPDPAAPTRALPWSPPGAGRHTLIATITLVGGTQLDARAEFTTYGYSGSAA